MIHPKFRINTIIRSLFAVPVKVDDAGKVLNSIVVNSNL